MSRRRQAPEQHFGSDSFLDIIGNIVGVLIILIVIAGLYVGNAPIAMVVKEAAESAAPVLTSDSLSLPQEKSISDEIASEPAEAVPAEPPIELIEKAIALEAEIGALERQTREHALQIRQASIERVGLLQDLKALQQGIQVTNDRVRQNHDQVKAARQARDEAHARLLESRRRLEEAAHNVPQPKTIDHQLTPVSRLVDGTEHHFRLAQDQVALVPISRLIARIQDQIQRRKNWLVKHRRHEGLVGPIGGFTMRYVVQRQALSLAEELRSGRAMMRIAVTQWRIEPEPDLVTESAVTAFQPASSFQQALRKIPRGSTLTFWVYPESFAIYRRLQQFAHRQGFVVAARPLPFDVPIAGSPRGTRSAGQ